MNRRRLLPLAVALLVAGCAPPTSSPPTSELQASETAAPSPSPAQPSPTSQPAAAVTEPAPTATWEPLTGEADPETVRLRLLNSHLSWNSLYAELQSTEYSPEGSDLLARIRRYQVWIQQPAQALVLSGRPDEPPNAVFVSDGRRYRLVYPEAARDEQGELPPSAQMPFLPPQSLGDTIYPHPLGGLIGFPVGEVLLPTIFGQRQGVYHVVGTATLADRSAIILDWTAPTGFVADRFHIDALTGLILRQQNLGKTGGGEAVHADIRVVRIVYDLAIPAELFNLDFADNPQYLEPPPG